MSYARLPAKAFNPHFSLESVSWNDKSPKDFEKRVKIAMGRAVEAGDDSIKEVLRELFKWATDTRLLRRRWDRLARYNGQAPGPNGRRYSDLRSDEVWRLLKAISESLREHTYKPQEAKRIYILKDLFDPKRGHRPISLINIEDRVIQRAIVELIRPLRDPFWSNNSYGSGRHRGQFHALASLEKTAFETNRWIWLADDVRDAYENVPRNRLKEALLKSIPANDLVELIMKLVDNGQKHGILQGGPLSPIMLNEYMEKVLHVYWSQQKPTIPLFRYVDDLLVLCKSKTEASTAATTLKERLQAAGMPLKSNEPVRDLRESGVSLDWLGFTISKGEDGLRFQIADKSWSRLGARLLRVHSHSNAPLRVNDIINGWIRQMGPAYKPEDRSFVLSRIAELAATQGFEEIPADSVLLASWKNGHKFWEKVCKGVHTPEPPPEPACPPLPPSDPNDKSVPFDVGPIATN